MAKLLAVYTDENGQKITHVRYFLGTFMNQEKRVSHETKIFFETHSPSRRIKWASVMLLAI